MFTEEDLQSMRAGYQYLANTKDDAFQALEYIMPRLESGEHASIQNIGVNTPVYILEIVGKAVVAHYGGE